MASSPAMTLGGGDSGASGNLSMVPSPTMTLGGGSGNLSRVTSPAMTLGGGGNPSKVPSPAMTIDVGGDSNSSPAAQGGGGGDGGSTSGDSVQSVVLSPAGTLGGGGGASDDLMQSMVLSPARVLGGEDDDVHIITVVDSKLVPKSISKDKSRLPSSSAAAPQQNHPHQRRQYRLSLTLEEISDSGVSSAGTKPSSRCSSEDNSPRELVAPATITSPAPLTSFSVNSEGRFSYPSSPQVVVSPSSSPPSDTTKYFSLLDPIFEPFPSLVSEEEYMTMDPDVSPPSPPHYVGDDGEEVDLHPQIEVYQVSVSMCEAVCVCMMIKGVAFQRVTLKFVIEGILIVEVKKLEVSFIWRS